MGKPSIIHQVKMRVEELYAIGKSKREQKLMWREICREKGIRWNPAFSPFIHSLATLKQFKQVCCDFAKWARREKGCRSLEEARKYVEEYVMRPRMDGQPRSPWSIRRDLAMLAKLYGVPSYELVKLDIPKRKRSVIKRSRVETKTDKTFNEERYKDLVDFCKGTGLRRKELKELRKKDIYVKGGFVYVHVRQGKGGREREVFVLPQYSEHVLKMRDRVANDEDRVFERIPKNMDVHKYRREYAIALYDLALEKRKENGIAYKRVYKARCVDAVFDRDILEFVSYNLGHNRVDVVVKHYSR